MPNSFIIGRTPVRVSYFGGGSDFKEYYDNKECFVISAAINKHSYIMARELPKFHSYKSRIVYSEIETVDDNSEIKHEVINKVLETLHYNSPIELIHASDVPGNSGLGSSSSFAATLLLVISALQSVFTTQKGIAEAVNILESQVLNHFGGVQDSFGCAIGGIKKIEFTKQSNIVNTMILSDEFIKELEESSLLIYTRIPRVSGNISRECFHQKNVEGQRDAIMEIAREGLKAFRNENIMHIGQLIDRSWQIKRSLSPNVSSPVIDEIISRITHLGGYAKLCGSGNGGSILTVFPKEARKTFLQEFKDLTIIPFKIEFDGTRVIYA